MKPARICALLGALLLPAGCTTPTSIEDDDVAVVRWGTSFGMCVGYCVQTLEVTPDEARLVLRGNRGGEYPVRSSARPIPEGEWQALTATIDPAAYRRLDEVYGCPDCADGGAEWVDFVSDGLRKRVTFEYGDPPEELAAAVQRLRAIRARFPVE